MASIQVGVGLRLGVVACPAVRWDVVGSCCGRSGSWVGAKSGSGVGSTYIGFLPVLDGAKNFVKFFGSEVGDVPTIVVGGGEVDRFGSFRFCNHGEAAKGGSEGVPRGGGG